MRGWLALAAKVVRRCHQPLPKVSLPDAIDHHPRSERIGWTGQPLRQFETAALVGGRDSLATEHIEKLARHFDTELLRIATLLEPGIPRLAFSHGVSNGYL